MVLSIMICSTKVHSRTFECKGLVPKTNLVLLPTYFLIVFLILGIKSVLFKCCGRWIKFVTFRIAEKL